MAGAQPALPGMPPRLFQAAPARLSTYLSCPRRYRMAYLDRPTPPKGPPWGHNSLGAAVHTVLANWWKLEYADRTADAIEGLLESAWLSDGFRDDRQAADCRAMAAGWLRDYVEGLDPADEPVGIERTVALKTEHAALFGRVDRIDERAGEGLVVVDYKTGRQLLTVDDARTSIALAIYAAAAARTLRRPCRRVELHHLPTGQVHSWAYPEESLARHLRRTDSLVAEIAAVTDTFRAGVTDTEADRTFPAQVGPLCGWCDFNRCCPEGSARFPPREPWAGI